jgi:hypothetical protein
VWSYPLPSIRIDLKMVSGTRKRGEVLQSLTEELPLVTALGWQ